jgi:hypothetical protein
VFIGQKFIGGSKRIMTLHLRNELAPMLKWWMPELYMDLILGIKLASSTSLLFKCQSLLSKFWSLPSLMLAPTLYLRKNLLFTFIVKLMYVDNIYSLNTSILR